MVERVFCPLCEQTSVCKQTIKEIETRDNEKKQVTIFITCGFWSEGAGRCAVGLLADGLKHINEKAERIASAAEAVYAVMDPEDDE